MTSYLNPSTRSGGVEQIVVPERQTVVPVDDAPFDDEQYVRVNGEWVPYQAPPIIPDTLSPKPPTNLGAAGTMAANGTRVDYELEWDAPTQNTDNSPLDDFAYYVVRWRYASGGVYQMFTTKETTFLLPSLRPATDVEWSVLARDYSGNDSTWADYVITGLADSTAPNQPSLPQLATRLGSVILAWDGLDFSAGAPPSDFDHLEGYMSATTGGPWEPIGRLGGAGFLAVAGIPVGETRFFTFIAFDTSGNASTRSGESSIEVLGVEGPDLEANSVTANALAAGAVQATHLTSVLALVTKICSSETGRRWEADADGIRVYEADGTILINFPTDPGTPSSFYGDLFASSLTVEDQLAIRGLINEISKGAQLVLASGTTAPSSPPTVTIDWEQFDTGYEAEYEGYNPARFGLVRWAKSGQPERWWMMLNPYGAYSVVSSYNDDGTRTVFGGDFFVDGMNYAVGLTVIGTDVYVLGKVYSDYFNFKWRVRGYTNAGVQIADWEWVRPANGSDPTIWNNGTYVMISWVQEDTHRLQWRPYNKLTGAAMAAATVLNLVTPANATPYAATYTAGDFGNMRLLVSFNGIPTVYSFDGTGVHQPNESFPLPSSANKGIYYHSGVFWTHDAAAHLLTKHTATTWLAESSTWYASNTWYDGDATGGTHETAQSPRKSFTMKKRARLNLTTAILPVRPIPNTTDDAKATRIYIGRGAADPGRTYMERMATLADGVRNWTSSSITLPAGVATSPPPATSDFPASSPGKLTSADGTTLVLQGDGTATLGTLEVGLNGGTTLKKAIELSVGDDTSTSQRLLRFFKKAASGTNVYESREYIYNDGTVSGKVAGIYENGVAVANFIMRPNAMFDVQGVGALVGSADIAIQGVSLGRGTASSNMYAEISANTTINVASTASVDVPGLAVTFTALAGRRYKVTVDGNVFSSVAGDQVSLQVKDGATVLKGAYSPSLTIANRQYQVQSIWSGALSAGSHTIKAGLARVSGGGNCNVAGGGQQRAFILVEDLGAI